MSGKSMLNDKQKFFLRLFSVNSNLVNRFYLTGGTALIEYYIPYRYSEDLDFFTEDTVDVESIMIFFKFIKPELKYKSIDFNTSYNRNLFFLNFDDSILKTEFTYFPFSQIEKPKKYEGIKINSILDIAVDKLFTIYQKPRSRDFMDLYMIQKKYGFAINELIKKARIKFDWNIDFVKLGSQFLLVTELKDYPKLIQPLKESEWQDFFLNEARKMKKKILID